MIRNEFRRAFIMLRAAMPGYGGHVRLERRTLTGSMYFIVTAPQGVNELTAALAGQQNGEYYAAPIGALTRDRRGQLALAWQFDPRAIDGRPLEAYAWVVVAATGGPCAVALTGNVEGARAMDPDALGRAVCALFAPAQPPVQAPAADLPEPEAAPVPPVDDSAFVAEQTVFEPEPAPEPVPTEPAAKSDMRGDVRIYTSTRARLRAAAQRARESCPTEPAPAGDPPQSQPAPEESASPSQPDSPDDAQEAQTAAQALGLDITAPWPGEAESLRRLFATQAPRMTLLGDGYTYVAAPLPAGAGYDESLVGLKAEDGRITAIRYALGGRRAPEPPAGLEGYRWVPILGDAGYWVLDVTDI